MNALQMIKYQQLTQTVKVSEWDSDTESQKELFPQQQQETPSF